MEFLKTPLVMVAISVTIGFIFSLAAILERDLIRAVVFSAVQAIAFAIAFFIFMAPDIVLAYIAIAVGVYSALLVLAISRTTRYEGGEKQ